MKKVQQWFSAIFNPEEFNDLDLSAIAIALNDSKTRSIWLANMIEDIKEINITVDRRLLNGDESRLTDLCARRRAYQDVLQLVLSARRQAGSEVRPNPKVPGINLDRVTA